MVPFFDKDVLPQYVNDEYKQLILDLNNDVELN